jgi:hypothetical protein
VEAFRNDHAIEVNPNIITGTIDSSLKYANQTGINSIINVKQILSQHLDKEQMNKAIRNSDIIVFPVNNGNLH